MEGQASAMRAEEHLRTIEHLTSTQRDANLAVQVRSRHSSLEIGAKDL